MRIIDLATLSLVGGSGIVESRIPLWWADGTTVSTTSTSGIYLTDGGTGSSSVTSATKLYTFPANWNPSQKFAVEVSIYSSNASNTTNVWVYDLTTSGTLADIQSSVTTETIVRSGNITIPVSHTIGLLLQCGSSGYTSYISDASLIIFPT